MKYLIKKITPSKVTKLYVDTINHISTKKFIFFAKEGNQNKIKKDLKDFIKNLDENQYLFGIYENSVHVANFKLTIKKNKAFIGFLVFLNFRGKGIIRKNFKKILRLQLLKNNKIKLLLLGVDKNNLHAITLYKKLGFKYKTKNKRKMYYKI